MEINDKTDYSKVTYVQTLWGVEIESRKCKVCDKTYPLTDQYFSKFTKDQKYFRSECRDCESDIRKEAYHKRREHIIEVKKNCGGCQHCGIDDWRVLVFHHRDPETKSFELSSAGHRSKELVDAEMAKCDILCHNCHNILHWELDNLGGDGKPRMER